MSKKDKFIVENITDMLIINGFGNLKGNLSLLDYKEKELTKLIKNYNNKEDNIRLILSLLDSIRELRGK